MVNIESDSRPPVSKGGQKKTKPKLKYLLIQCLFIEEICFQIQVRFRAQAKTALTISRVLEIHAIY